MAPHRDQFHQKSDFITLDAKTRLERFHQGSGNWMEMDRLNCDWSQVNLPVDVETTMNLVSDTTIFSRILQIMIKFMG
jgi:hypothetical protein